MTKHNAKVSAVKFCENLKDFNGVVVKIKSAEVIEEKDLQKLQDAQKKMATASRAYLNDLNVRPDIIQLVAPLINGELNNVDDPDFMRKIAKFEENFTKIASNVKKELNNRSEKELLEMFAGGLRDSKGAQSLEIKLEAIQRKLISALHKP